jgi:hypothetical protein
MIPIRISLCAIVLAAVWPSAAQAQSLSDDDRPQVMVLGTFHFANPGRDIVKFEVADVLSPAKQAEILDVIETLARFQPTKIAIEDLPSAAPRIDSLYDAYRAGQHMLSRSESEQLGFRLAARLEHARLYPINHFADSPFEAMMAYAEEHDPAFLEFVEAEMLRATEESNRRQREHTIGEILRMTNDPGGLAADHGVYMRFVRVGAVDTFIGADVTAKWYERNIKIFANLQRIAEPGDRILVVYGSGHAPILRDLVTYDRGMDLVEPLEYLP